MQTTQASVKAGNLDDQDYSRFLADFSLAAGEKQGPLFTTDADNLWDLYLSAFEGDARQHHTCHACRKFIESYGNLVTIAPDGTLTPFLWNIGPWPFPDLTLLVAFNRLSERVSRAKVTGIFYSSEPMFGVHQTGVWRHMSVKNPHPWASKITTAFQAMAEKRTEYATVSRALSEFSLAQLDEAVRILEADALDRSEKTLGQAKWLRDLKAGSHRNRSVVWLAVGTAPAGFCHPRSSMISTLLDDIAAGVPFAEVERRWAAKMHPLRYQRPTAPAKEGAIRQAEALVASLGTAGSLQRRFALLADVPVRLWTPVAPTPAQPVEGRVFDKLRANPAPTAAVLPEKRMTWDKFSRDVLPTAQRIDYHTRLQSGNYGVFTTAVDPAAPLIFQWDNALAWYVWFGGSKPSQFGLPSASWVEVAAICEKPPHFTEPEKFAHHRRGLMLVLAGAKDTRNSGSGIFPECLKSEYHGVRSVMENYSKVDHVVDCGEGQRAQGLILEHKEQWDALVRVTVDGKMALYRLDRWD